MKRKLIVLMAVGLLVGTVIPPAGGVEKSYYCFGVEATIVGTPAGEYLPGTTGSDVIVARGGADLVFGGAGNDLICGGLGNDWTWEDTVENGGGGGLYGGSGDDWIRGGRGIDTLSGDGYDEGNGVSGADVLYGGPGRDTLHDYISAHEYASPEPLPGSDDLLFGGPGDDTVTATAGDDFLSGGLGNDSMGNRSLWDWDDWSYEESLDHGADLYVGGQGDDRIETFDGVAGNDTVNAGEQTDRCAEDEGDTIWSCEEDPVLPN